MFRAFRAPETMTAAHDASRDHVLYSMALGTGLRLSEVLGLDVGDVSPDCREVRQRVVGETHSSRRCTRQAG